MWLRKEFEGDQMKFQVVEACVKDGQDYKLGEHRLMWWFQPRLMRLKSL